MAKLKKNFKVDLGKQAVKGVVQQAVQQIIKNELPKADINYINEIEYQKYKLNGLNYKSNLPGVVNRTDNGDVIIDIDDSSMLVIEPTNTNITMKSVLRIVETRFNYFNFPAITTVENLDLDLDLDFVQDPIFARYKPSDNRKILSGAKSGILIDELEEGQLQKRPNQYYITKEIKESGVDLRFRVKINFRYDSIPPPGPTESVEYKEWLAEAAEDVNTTHFYIARSGPNKYLKRDYIPYFDFEIPHAGGGKIFRYQVQNAYKDVVIANSEFDVGDKFGITAEAGNNDTDKYSTINADQTYWSITDASKNVDEWNREI